MQPDFTVVHHAIQDALEKAAPAAQLTVRLAGRSVYAQAFGYLDPDTRQRAIQRTSMFDAASLTKLYTATLFMRMVEERRIELDQPVSQVLPAFSGLRPVLPYEDPQTPGGWVDLRGQAHQPGGPIVTVDASEITFRQLLRHSAGLPAWRPLKDQASPAEAWQMAVDTFFAYQPDTRMVYSDLGMILLGKAIEQIAGRRLDAAIDEWVTGPLGLVYTRYLPSGSTIPLSIAPTEWCRWRKRRILGEVHDENASRLGGVSGHAGLFTTADELARFGQIFLPQTARFMSTGPLTYPLRSESVAEMTRVQFEHDGERRGLGFELWYPDPGCAGYAFGPASFGHTGYTGASLWIDPPRQLIVALMTNEIYHGREQRLIRPLRAAVHRVIVEVVDRAIQAEKVNQDAAAA